MKKYLGVKLIEAKEMNLGDYNDYRGWKIPQDEDPTKKGWLVKYPDGYESWSPDKVFIEAYRECETFYDRLLIETQDLAVKLNDLNAFMGTEKFVALDRENKDLLYEQQRSMSKYIQILGKRLEINGEGFKFYK